MVLICPKEGTTAGIMARSGHRESEQGLGPGGLASSLPSPAFTPSEPGSGPSGPAQATPLNEEGPFLPTGLARGECATNIRFLSFLQCGADDKIITSRRGYRLNISTGSRMILRVAWNVTE